jgi:hypothetical protein
MAIGMAGPGSRLLALMGIDHSVIERPYKTSTIFADSAVISKALSRFTYLDAQVLRAGNNVSLRSFGNISRWLKGGPDL